MNTLRVKKLNPHAVLPSKANPGDAGFDLTATSWAYGNGYIEYYTGIAVEIPQGCVGLLYPRSSVSNTDLMLANSVGVIDSGYRGELILRFKAITDEDGINMYSAGDRIGQLVIQQVPKFDIELVEELPESRRGAGGFGSSGS